MALNQRTACWYDTVDECPERAEAKAAELIIRSLYTLITKARQLKLLCTTST